MFKTGIAVIATLGLSSLLLPPPKQDVADNEDRATIFKTVKAATDRFNGYQKWPMLTNGMVESSEGMYYQCAIRGLKHWEEVNKRMGPHWSPGIRVYANAIAKKAVDDEKSKFPAGSILIKEKLRGAKVTAITAMVRKEDDALYKQYGRGEINWRFYYFDRHENVQIGRVEKCIACHQKSGKTDGAFLKYPETVGEPYAPFEAVGEEGYLK